MMPPSPLTGRSFESLKSSKDDKQEKKDKKDSSHCRSKSSPCWYCGSGRHSGDYKVDKHENRPEGVQVIGRLVVKFIDSLICKNGRLQKHS